MTSGEQPYWFPAKRYGWGWGLPRAWQGWVILLGYFAAVLAGCLWILPTYGALTFVAYTALLTAVLLAVCWAKGERPRWRWGED